MSFLNPYGQSGLSGTNTNLIETGISVPTAGAVITFLVSRCHANVLLSMYLKNLSGQAVFSNTKTVGVNFVICRSVLERLAENIVESSEGPQMKGLVAKTARLVQSKLLSICTGVLT